MSKVTGTSMIRRIQVEDGFLDGLDLEFTAGLNVLIGPRGAGKTSIIELIRYCLGVPGHTEKYESVAREHALGVLGSGLVTVTLADAGTEIQVSRSVEDLPRRQPYKYVKPIVLSQNEIESVGVESAARLRIIDGFLQSGQAPRRLDSLVASIRSLTVEIATASSELRDLAAQVETLAPVIKELAEAKKAQTIATSAVTKAKTQQARLTALSLAGATASVRQSVLERSIQSMEKWNEQVEDLAAVPIPAEDWPDSAGPDDWLESIRSQLDQAKRHIALGSTTITKALTEARLLLERSRRELAKIQDQSRTLRQDLEKLQKGAGAMARRVTDLQEKAGQLSALRSLVKSKEQHLASIQDKRGDLLSQVESLRADKYLARTRIAKSINADLGPAIRVVIRQSGLQTELVSAISAALRGTGLHYNKLAPAIATCMSPRELAEAVESNRPDIVAELCSIDSARSEKIVNELSAFGTEGILTAHVEDIVSFQLLDGAEYKPVEHTSTGQRCTVVLPILLMHRDRVLVVDQPEDNLDNGFIVATLVKSLRNRNKSQQLIFSTHNANIPVLAEADQVVVMGSDGRRGFVQHSGRLDSLRSVEAITQIMEGGQEAFDRRAAFYESRRLRSN